MSFIIQAAYKQEFLEEIKKEDFALTGQDLPSQDDIQAIAERFGLAPGFTSLLESIADGDRSFMTDAVRVLKVGADTQKVPSLWLIAMWKVVADVIDDLQLKETAANVVDLHFRTLAGQSVERSEWRKARRAFTTVTKGVSEAAAEVIAAGAWDPAIAGQSIADASRSLYTLGTEQWAEKVNWSAEEVQRCNELEAAAGQHGREAAGEVPEDPTQVAAWIERYKTTYTAYCEMNCPQVLVRENGCKETCGFLNSESRRIFVEACAAAE